MGRHLEDGVGEPHRLSDAEVDPQEHEVHERGPAQHDQHGRGGRLPQRPGLYLNWNGGYRLEEELAVNPFSVELSAERKSWTPFRSRFWYKPQLFEP